MPRYDKNIKKPQVPYIIHKLRKAMHRKICFEINIKGDWLVYLGYRGISRCLFIRNIRLPTLVSVVKEA